MSQRIVRSDPALRLNPAVTPQRCVEAALSVDTKSMATVYQLGVLAAEAGTEEELQPPALMRKMLNAEAEQRRMRQWRAAQPVVEKAVPAQEEQEVVIKALRS
eukprot:COSAG04_NODE_402_length_14902_cov_9.662771_2_plen_103_part_00